MALDADEPVNLAETKMFMRVDYDHHDNLIETLIVAAREWCEGRTGLALKPREQIDVFDDFSGPIELTAWPVDAESVTIDYADAVGYDTGFDDFTVQGGKWPNVPVTIIPATGASWPVVSTAGRAVTVTYDAGYDPYTDVPDQIRVAIMMLATARYRQASGETDKPLSDVPFGVDELLRRYRKIAFA